MKITKMILHATILGLGAAISFSASGLTVTNKLSPNATVNQIAVSFAVGVCWYTTISAGQSASRKMTGDCNHRKLFQIGLGSAEGPVVRNMFMDASGQAVVYCRGSDYVARLCDAHNNCGDDTFKVGNNFPACGK